jgi:hypothetical protein
MPGITPTAEDVLSTMRAIADGLSAAGLDIHLHETYGTIEVMAVDRERDIEAIIGDDGYVELRFWRTPGALPAQVCATIARAIGAITSETAPPGERRPAG